MSAEVLKPKFVRFPSSARRTCRNYLWPSYANFFKFYFVGCPRPYTKTLLEYLKRPFPIFHIFFCFRYRTPNGSKNLKKLPLPQVAIYFFQICPRFSSQLSSNSTVLDFFRFWEFPNFHDFFSLTWDPIGTKIQTLHVLTHPLKRIWIVSFFSEFSSQWFSDIKYCNEILKICNIYFLYRFP